MIVQYLILIYKYLRKTVFYIGIGSYDIGIAESHAISVFCRIILPLVYKVLKRWLESFIPSHLLPMQHEPTRNTIVIAHIRIYLSMYI